MKKIAILVFCAFLFAANVVKAGGEVAFWAAAGTGVGALQQSYGSVNPKDAITTVCLQFWTPTASGGVTKGADNPSSFVTWAHQNGIKVLLTVANNASWDWNLASSAFGNANAFATALINEANAYQMDGIDLDLEGYGISTSQSSQTRTQFSAFITTLSGKLKASTTNCKMLTVCTTADAPDNPDNVPNSDWWKDWVGKVDFVHDMLYAEGGEADCEGSDPNVVGDDQYYYSTQQGIGKAVGYAASQISMCIPSFNTENAAGWQSKWSTHFDQLLKIGASIGVWDLKLSDPNWTSSALWTKLKQFKTSANNNSLAITATSGGKVTTSPTGTSFAPGTVVTLTAVPDAGFKFVSWSGDFTGTATTASVTMNANKTITATFALTSGGGAFDMFANGTWDSYIDTYGSKITMTKTATALTGVWTLVKQPTDNDYPYVGVNVDASAGSYKGLTSVIVTYKSTSNLLISLTDPALASDGDCYQYSLPISASVRIDTLALSDFQQPSNPTKVAPLRLDSITDIDFTPDMELSTTTGGAGNFVISGLIVNGTTLSGASAISNKHVSMANMSASPIIKNTPAGLEISNIRNTRSIVVYNAIGRAIATLTPSMSQRSVMKVPMGKTNGILFVRFSGTNGSSSVQRIIR